LKREARIGLLYTNGRTCALIVTRGFKSIDEVKISLNTNIVDFLKSVKTLNEISYIVTVYENDKASNILARKVGKSMKPIKVIPLSELLKIINSWNIQEDIKNYIEFFINFINKFKSLASKYEES